MEVATFKLERWFARYEFAVRHLLCSSDSETLSVRDLLALDAQPDAALQGLLDLRLGYTGAAPSSRRPNLVHRTSKLKFSSPSSFIFLI
jgi:hypothetical protein